MRSFLLLVVFCSSVSWGFVMIEKSVAGTDSNHCQSASYDIGVMTVGAEAQVPGHCMIAKCMANGHISYEGCSSVGLPPGCRFKDPDPNAPFPKCCKYDFVC